MRSTIRRGAVAAIISVLALANLPSVPAGAASGPKAPPFAAGGYRQLPAPQLVNVRPLRATSPAEHPALARPKLVKNHAAPTLPPSASRRGKLSSAPRSPQPATPMTGTTQGTILEQLTAFPAMDITTGATLFGPRNNMEPPDP